MTSHLISKHEVERFHKLRASKTSQRRHNNQFGLVTHRIGAKLGLHCDVVMIRLIIMGAVLGIYWHEKYYEYCSKNFRKTHHSIFSLSHSKSCLNPGSSWVSYNKNFDEFV